MNLTDFNNWKRLNSSMPASIPFSLYDYLFHKVSNKSGTGTDVFFAFLELLYPTFIEHEGYIFLKENFKEDYFQRLKSENSQVEYWMNLLTVDSYFDDDDEWEEKSRTLAKAMVEIWQMKLKKEFPHREFVVRYLEDNEVGDYGLTFYTA